MEHITHSTLKNGLTDFVSKEAQKFEEWTTAIVFFSFRYAIPKQQQDALFGCGAELPGEMKKKITELRLTCDERRVLDFLTEHTYGKGTLRAEFSFATISTQSGVDVEIVHRTIEKLRRHEILMTW